MKKLSLSLGAVLLSGLVLASCGANTSIKAPSKGKAVDSVTFNGTSGSVEIKKDDNYNDVVEHILDEGFTLELTDDDATESSYIGTREDTKSITGKNYLTTTSDIALSIPGGKQKVLSDKVIYENLSLNSSSKTSADNYFKDEGKDGNTNITVYAELNSDMKFNVKADKYKVDYEYKTANAIAGTYKEDNTNVSVDAGKYMLYSIKGSTTNRDNSGSGNMNRSMYQYLDKSVKIDSDELYATYSGYSGDTYVSYKVSTFFNTDFDNDFETEVPFYTFAMSPEENMKDFYDASFELTDKYIILKIKIDYTNQMMAYALSELEDEDKMPEKLKELKNKEFKGSYQEYEIWIDYSNKDDDSYSELTYAYYNSTVVDKEKIEKDITKEYLEDRGYNVDLFEDFIGKKESYTINNKTTQTIAVNGNKYDSKIKNFKAKCKKNNIFDKITMKADN